VGFGIRKIPRGYADTRNRAIQTLLEMLDCGVGSQMKMEQH
jgi:hypothetical protein